MNALLYRKIPKYLFYYLIITIVLFIVGPVEWKTRNSLLTFCLIIIYSVSFYVGSKRAVSKIKTASIPAICVGPQNSLEPFVIKWFYPLYIISFVMLFMSLIRISRLFGWNSFSDILLKIFSNQYSELYYSTKLASSGSDMFGGTAFSIIGVLLSPLSFITAQATIFYFKKYSFSKKIISILYLAVFLFNKLSMGRTEGIFTFILCVGVPFLFLRSSNNNKKTKKTNKINNTTFIVILIAVIILIVFNSVMDDRMHGTTNFGQLGENIIRKGGWVYEHTPIGLRNLLIWVDVYLCQGYYGMSLATTLSWKPMFGLGYSRWFCEEISGLISPQIYKALYSYRIEEAGYAWGDYANWHSAYTWIANDVSWIGVIIVLFALGYFLTMAIYDVQTKNNFCSVGCTTLLIQMTLFLPANNLLFQSGSSFMTFWFVFIMWIFKHYNVHIKIRR